MLKTLLFFSAATALFASPAQASCFNYEKLAGNEKFAIGFSAAACTGYAAATQEASSPQAFTQLKTIVVNVADVGEEMYCPSRTVVVGATGDTDSKFSEGYKMALANASMVQKGIMPLSEFQMRVKICTQVTGHYLQLLKK